MAARLTEGVPVVATDGGQGSGLALRPGRPTPLGARRTADGVAFAVFAPDAPAVRLVLATNGMREEIRLLPGDHRTGDVWHVEVVGLAPPLDYSWRLEDAAGEPGPDLLDPYGRLVAGAERWGEAPPGGRRWRSRIAVEEPFDWEGTRRPRHEPTDRVVYELGVRGFTRDPSSGVEAPGTFRGLIEKIPYLVDLGVTTVELLPIFEWNENEVGRVHLETGEPLRNLWGYSPLAFFAPKTGLASDASRPTGELKTLVRELHRAGLEVVLDVVYNHTGEKDLGPGDPRFSFRGLARDTYYLRDPAGRRLDVTGCGNTLRAAHPVVQDLVLDSLRHWATELRVDGFRFDLASALTRGDDGHALADPPLVRRIGADPVLSHRALIAEAWDAGSLYQVGVFPHWGPWAEWNGPFRDDVRRFVRGDAGFVRALAQRLLGSPDLYRASGGSPASSINYVACHDGFTLADLVSYQDKHNWANGEWNRDGSDHDHAANYGVEGPTSDPEILAVRRRQTRNLLTLLFLAQGVPMILAGDEFGRTQRGNNNAWCQDNPTGWVDWTRLEANRELHRFVKGLIAFRKAHPVLRRPRFLRERAEAEGPAEVLWHGVRPGSPDLSETSRSLAMELRGGEGEATIYLATNAWREPLVFTLPEPPEGQRWHCAVDTAEPPPADLHPPGEEPRLEGTRMKVGPFACVVLVAR